MKIKYFLKASKPNSPEALPIGQRDITKTLLQKWNNIFDSFVKSYKKNKTLKSGSSFRRIRKYIFHDQLQFLAKTIEHNTTTSSISQEKNTETMAQQNVDDSSNEGDSQID
ncbi:unnamed protein product [Acanthoscelides obtectus]|uniref:Uncharacterized protein n=1 Tax=Acanthoscelides obtectus TaxID=200917 RepID=A0A9P0PBK8_ACAOB|nr:unnamed protein product [Acanthoscelides obtectus]CAK1665308.1 hypothetical protein AOBTE_LOCUS24752 [Acanthoscelides obtectus]